MRAIVDVCVRACARVRAIQYEAPCPVLSFQSPDRLTRMLACRRFLSVHPQAIVMVIVFSIKHISDNGPDPSFSQLASTESLSSLPLFLATVVYSYEGCGAVLPIENALLEPHKFRKICYAGFATFFVCYTLIGLLGYAAFPFGRYCCCCCCRGW